MPEPHLSPSDPPPAPSEALEAALRSSCSALLAVEAIRADAHDLTGEMQRLYAQLTRSIQELRAAIRALRQAGGPAAALASGFVLPGEPGDSTIGSDQVTP